jgi:hypothetical protein
MIIYTMYSLVRNYTIIILHASARIHKVDQHSQS